MPVNAQTFIKQAKYGVTGHVYEHVVANHITSTLRADGHMRLLDYELSADSYDGIVVISIESHHAVITELTASLLAHLTITEEDVAAALSQVACEYARPATFEIPKLHEDIQKLHSKPWINKDGFTFTKSITDESRSFETPAGKLEDENESAFETFEVVYELPDCPLHLKPLAVYLLQALGLAHVDHAYEKLERCYDAGDEWATYQDLVGYLTNLRVHKNSSVTVDDVRAIEKESRESALQNNFDQKLVDLVLRQIEAKYPFFSDKAMFANAYVIPGKKGWQQVATPENVQSLLKKLQVTVEKT